MRWGLGYLVGRRDNLKNGKNVFTYDLSSKSQNMKTKQKNRKKWKVNIDKIFNLINTIISITSLVIAIVALSSITKVEGFGELLEKTSENSIKLNRMIEELKEQNLLQQTNIEDNKDELDEIKKQTKSLIDLQKTNDSQLEIQQKENISEQIGDYLILDHIYWEVYEFKSLIIGYESIFINEKFREQTIQCLSDLKSIVFKGIDNKLLKMDNKIYSQWWAFYQQVDFTLNSIRTDRGILKYYDIPLNVTYGNGLTKSESELMILNQFKQYFNTFWIKGVQPILEMKEMRLYREMYLELSNHGRPIKN